MVATYIHLLVIPINNKIKTTYTNIQNNNTSTTHIANTNKNKERAKLNPNYHNFSF